VSLSQKSEQIEKIASNSNRVVELAVLLEPLYWPYITGKMTWLGGIGEGEYQQLLEDYRPKVFRHVSALDSQEWKSLHENLRLDAARMDANAELYMLLRASTWNVREKLKGPIASALWFRHIAEIIRLAFEEIHRESWPEEDQGFGVWMKGGRSLVYGSERPLTDVQDVRHHIAVNFGLVTGSVVRWYVEGDTEYHAILSILPEPARSNIELVNLRGNLTSGKGNIAMKLEDALEQDRNLRRFSFVSFDTDVPENMKFIRRQVEQNHIIGSIAAHEPDFEFANFEMRELVEVAAQLDEQCGFSGTCLREADWTGIKSGKQFEERYKEVSCRGRSLKGEEWGRALAKYASENPERDTSERPFWRELKSALWARRVRYDQHFQCYSFDVETFAVVTKKPEH
jgi:hypothetical protein